MLLWSYSSVGNTEIYVAFFPIKNNISSFVNPEKICISSRMFHIFLKTVVIVGLHLHEWLMTIRECNHQWDGVCLFRSEFIHQWPDKYLADTFNWALLLLTAVQEQDSVLEETVRCHSSSGRFQWLLFPDLRILCRGENLTSYSLYCRKYPEILYFHHFLLFRLYSKAGC